MVLSPGGMLYVGGDFTDINATVPRNRLAAFDTSNTGNEDVATAWNPDADGPVYTLAFSGATVYVGGDFTSMNNISRDHIAAVVAADGALVNWRINTGNSVRTLSVSADGATIFVGGLFTSIGGVVRNRIAALDLVNGNATSWDPGANDTVRSLVISDDSSSLYVGGDFTVIAGKTRNRIASIERTTGLAESWNPDADGAVYAMTLSEDGQLLYAGGEFTTFNAGATARNHVASLFTDTINNAAIVSNWDPDASDGAVRAMALFGTILYVGGDFTVNGTIGAENRNHIAALRTSSSSATAWDPDADDNVLAMSLSADGRLLYVGGKFTDFDDGSITRNHLAVLDTTAVVAEEMLTDWDPDVDDVVRTLSLSRDESTLYVGGDFTTIGSGSGVQTRNRIAALSTDGGVPINWWDADADAPLVSLQLSGDRGMLYAGGSFTQLNGNARSYYTAMDISIPQTTAVPAAGAYNSNQDIVLLCNDSFGSGCATTYYTTDGTTPTTSSTPYSTAINITTDTTIQFFSLDNAGNHEAVQSAAYTMDSVAPVTTAVPASGLLGLDNNSITLTCNDAGGGCAATYYTLDGTVPTTSSTVYIEPIVMVDDTTLMFFSVDTAGNIESSIKSETYSVDVSVPRTSALPATRVFDSSSLSITLSCDDTPLPEVPPGPGDIPEGAVDPNTGTFPNPNDFNNPAPGDFTTTAGAVLSAAITNTGTGCVSTYYTTDGTTPTTASTPYVAPIKITDNTIIKFFSVDGAGNEEGVKLESYISHKSSIGAIGPSSLWLCLTVILLRLYDKRRLCR